MASARASREQGPVVLGGSVALGGIVIRDGGLIITEEDGVVVWPQERIAELLGQAEARLQQGNTRLTRMRGER